MDSMQNGRSEQLGGFTQHRLSSPCSQSKSCDATLNLLALENQDPVFQNEVAAQLVKKVTTCYGTKRSTGLRPRSLSCRPNTICAKSFPQVFSTTVSS